PARRRRALPRRRPAAARSSPAASAPAAAPAAPATAAIAADRGPDVGEVDGRRDHEAESDEAAVERAARQGEEAECDIGRQHDAPELLGALTGRGEGARWLAQRVHEGPHLERERAEHEREEEPALQPSDNSHPGSLRSAALSRRGPGGGWPHWR